MGCFCVFLGALLAWVERVSPDFGCPVRLKAPCRAFWVAPLDCLCWPGTCCVLSFDCQYESYQARGDRLKWAADGGCALPPGHLGSLRRWMAVYSASVDASAAGCCECGARMATGNL